MGRTDARSLTLRDKLSRSVRRARARSSTSRDRDDELNTICRAEAIGLTAGLNYDDAADLADSIAKTRGVTDAGQSASRNRDGVGRAVARRSADADRPDRTLRLRHEPHPCREPDR